MNYNIIDIETYNNEEKFIAYCVCLKVNKEIKVFYGEKPIEELLDWMKNLKKKITIYAHNLSFDGALIIEKINPKIFEIKPLIFRNSIYSITMINKTNNNIIELRCSYKLFPLPLKKIGNLFENYNKLDFPHKFVKSDKIFYIGEHPELWYIKEWNLKEECIKYCIRDLEIVEKFMKKINENIDLKIIEQSKSISSLALKIFDKSFNYKKINISLHQNDDELIRESYYGGRCEVFGNAMSNENIYHFDFTGMYSQIMKEETFCFGKPYISKEKKIDKPGFYKVRVLSIGFEIPILPYRDEKNKKLIFPNGTWVSTYWWEELVLFEEKGGIIIEIIEFIGFNNHEKIFDKFIENYEELRKIGKFENIFWKLFVNSLSGRLGMQSTNEKNILTLSDEEYTLIREKGYNIIRERRTNNIRLITVLDDKKKEFTQSNVALTSAITSKARIKLFKAYEETINNNGRLLYSDTDSIFAAFNENPFKKKWNLIKWEEGIDEAVFCIPKGYALKNKFKTIIKLKGFMVKNISFDEFKDAFENHSNILEKQEHFKKIDLIPYLVTTEKNTKLWNYTKRTFSKDRKNTKPINIYA